jgi:hypothetical protein
MKKLAVILWIAVWACVMLAFWIYDAPNPKVSTKATVSTETNPRPVRTAPYGMFYTYWHWECPNGFHKEETNGFIWCEADAERDKRMEEYERKLQPVGK